jgi:hypothetical protein
MIKRRRILLGGLGVALAAVGLWGAGIAGESEIASAVRRRLGFLRLDEGGLHAFAKDYVHSVTSHASSLLAQRSSWLQWKFRIQTIVRGRSNSLGLTHDSRTRHERMEESWATLFLLSSNFFTTGADESRVVRYVALYDPMRACGNPFARPCTDNLTPLDIASTGKRLESL